VSTAEDLARHLSELSPRQLTDLLEQRELPYAAHEFAPEAIRTLGDLASHLLSDASTARGLADLNAPQTQLLIAAATLAQRLHGPLPAPSPRSDHHIMFGAPGRPRQASLSARADSVSDPSDRAVPRTSLLNLLGLGGGERRRAENTLRQLRDALLVLPTREGDAEESIVLPPLLHRQATRLAGLGRPVDQLLSQAYQAAEIQRVHRGLALPTGRTRDERQRAIVALLSQPDEVRTLAAQAPPEARDLLESLVGGPPLLRTHCFESRYGAYYASDMGPFVFRPGGSGDPGTDWLAERGMVIPVGHDLAELPYEVGQALRDPDARPAYRPDPPEPSEEITLAAPSSAVLREAHASAADVAARIELLLRHVDAQPLTLRKAGGIAVRDTRRVAKQSGITEQQARFWLDLAANADLLGIQEPETAPTSRGRSRRPAPPTAPPLVVPTERYDRWLAAPPAERLLPLISTWTAVPEVLTWWPDSDDSAPVALVSPQDPSAVLLRRALLEALAASPDGRGINSGAPRAFDWLTEAVTWHRPSLAIDPNELGSLISATLAEAHLLGVAAHGALTPIGRAALDLLRAGGARYFPAIPATGPSLAQHPHIAEAVASLQRELDALLPAPTGTARFQADLTAIVAGAPAADLTDLLSSCADRESEGHAVVWRVSAASVRRALDAGHDADDLLTRLAEVSEGRHDLPQPLVYLIKDTARIHGRVRVVRSACCIRSDDESLVLELSKTRSLAKIGLRRIAPTVLISTADPDTTLTALRNAGFAPTLEAETGTTVIQRPDRDRVTTKPLRLADAFRSPGRNGTTAPALAEALLRSRR
jgi:hypothetical protein